MPVYEYQCTKCDHNFELRQGFDAEPICNCPQCASKSRRLFKPAPIIFKGSGFYVTDYNGKSPAAAASEESEAKPEPKPAAATTTESKETSTSSDA